ncbi:MAG: hypothetical protein IPG24_20220 [Leptospiraceae bacterium]|nr:hypothetical protein [Leptospiraceae bacterium]
MLPFNFYFPSRLHRKDVRLADPATPEESAKQGVVAFGIYRVFKGSDLLKKLTFEHRAARNF